MRLLIGMLGLMILVSCQSGSTIESTKFKTILIKSDGEAETLPNLATFHINLNCLDKSIKTSKNCLIEKSNELNTKLQSFGINKDDILTTSINLNKSFTWRNNSSIFEGYNSSTTLFVTIRNLENLEEIYTELLENKNLDLGGLNYSHSELDSLKNEAYVNALEKSSILADKLLDKLTESKKEILKIGNVEISVSIPEANEAKNQAEYDMSESNVSKNKSISISKGTIIVNATLFVEYQIK